MATVFTRILAGEIPGQFVWRDERAAAFLSINPLQPGHTLVVPCAEVDHWLDLEADLLAHLTSVSQAIGKALMTVYSPVKVGFLMAGLEVPHAHLHVVPIRGVHDLDFANADPMWEQARLATEAERIRAALRAAGHG